MHDGEPPRFDWDMEHSPLTFEGRIEGLGRMHGAGLHEPNREQRRLLAMGWKFMAAAAFLVLAAVVAEFINANF